MSNRKERTVVRPWDQRKPLESAGCQLVTLTEKTAADLAEAKIRRGPPEGPLPLDWAKNLVLPGDLAGDPAPPAISDVLPVPVGQATAPVLRPDILGFTGFSSLP